LAYTQGTTEPNRPVKYQHAPSAIEELKRLADKFNVAVDAIDDVSILAEPVRAGELVIPNSLAVHPMESNDGDTDGRPGELTFRRYERFAAGGAGLIWVEAIAVVPQGRAYPRQLWLNRDNAETFAALIDHIKKTAQRNEPTCRPVVVAQLTHSGRYSKPDPVIAQHDPYRDAMTLQPEPDPNATRRIPEDWPVVTDQYLDGLVDAYVEAAALAFDVGFDAVDIKSCHGYLASELLSCHTRKGKYGGSFENRTRLLLNIIDAIRQRLGDDRHLVTRLGLYDGVPYPFGWGVDKGDYRLADLTEPKKLVALLVQRGLRMINVSIANPRLNPHYGRPYDRPVAGAYEQPEHPLVGVARLIGLAGDIQKEFPDIAIVGTGYSWLRTLMPNVAAASKRNGLAKIVGVGRMAFAYPDFARDIILNGRLDSDKVCVTCSRCSRIMANGGMTGCVVRDKEIYGPIYRRLCSNTDQSRPQVNRRDFIA